MMPRVRQLFEANRRACTSGTYPSRFTVASTWLCVLAPTLPVLFSTFDTVADVLAAGDARDVRPVLPKIVLGDDDEARLLLPHDEGYAG